MTEGHLNGLSFTYEPIRFHSVSGTAAASGSSQKLRPLKPP
jgi:hypothetical protein